MLELKSLFNGEPVVVYFRTKDELYEFKEEWDRIGGSFLYKWLFSDAEKGDLCLFLRNNGHRYSWTWSSKEHGFSLPTKPYTVDQLRVGPNDLGDILDETCNITSLFGGNLDA